MVNNLILTSTWQVEYDHLHSKDKRLTWRIVQAYSSNLEMLELGLISRSFCHPIKPQIHNRHISREEQRNVIDL